MGGPSWRCACGSEQPYTNDVCSACRSGKKTSAFGTDRMQRRDGSWPMTPSPTQREVGIREWAAGSYSDGKPHIPDGAASFTRDLLALLDQSRLDLAGARAERDALLATIAVARAVVGFILEPVTEEMREDRLCPVCDACVSWRDDADEDVDWPCDECAGGIVLDVAVALRNAGTGADPIEAAHAAGRAEAIREAAGLLSKMVDEWRDYAHRKDDERDERESADSHVRANVLAIAVIRIRALGAKAGERSK